MSAYWDNRHNVPVYKWNTIAGSAVSTDHPSRNIVTAAGTPEDEFDIDSLFVPGDSDVLLIAFHGAVVRENVDLPRFEWLQALAPRKENKLFIADTTLQRSDKLTLGWYIGSTHDDLTLKLARYIQHVVKIRGIKKTVLLGSSGGGYAAMAIATYLHNACAVAFTPQSNVWEFSEGHSANFLASSFPEYDSIDAVAKDMPHRFSLKTRYASMPWLNRFIYYQNLGDHAHLYTHRKPFAESLGVRLPNGRTFNQSGQFLSEFHGEGHVRPPKERLNPLLDEAILGLDTAVKLPVSSAGFTGNLLDHRFNRDANLFEVVPYEQNSYYLSSAYPIAPPADNVWYDADGVPYRTIDGVNHDHPVLQAQYMLKLFNTYRITGQIEVLNVLKAVADRLIAYSVPSRGARYLPYGFPWNQGKQIPPWYSAMAQGQVLSAVSRLYEVCPEPKYKEFCASLFASFLNLRQGNEPWVVDIDDQGYLWLEEYPHGEQGKSVINGHLFAAWGLYDYWRVLHEETALELANAALATVKFYFPLFRNPGWSSNYDVTDFYLIRNYHQTHISQFEITYNLTGDIFFSQMSDVLEADFPSHQRNGSLYLGAGKHQFAKMDNTGVPTKVVETIEATVEKAVAVGFIRRTKIETDSAIWLLIGDGEHEGLWTREEPKVSFPRLCFDKHIFARRRRLLLSPGTYVHNTFNQWGSVLDRQVLAADGPLYLDVQARALWNGVEYYQLAGDELEGRWMAKATPNSYLY